MGQATTTNAITDVVSQVLTSNSSIVTLGLTNTGSDTVYVGSDNNVTDSNGFPIYAGEELKCNDYVGNWWAICATGEASTIRVDQEVV